MNEKFTKVKTFLKEHKKEFVNAAGGFCAAGAVIGYNIGLRKGLLNGVGEMACAVYTDVDGTACMVETWMKDIPDAQLKEVVEFGKKVIEEVSK